MRLRVRVLLASVVATAFLLAPPLAPAVGADPGPATTIECGQVITTDVVLSHDLHCPDGIGLLVSAGATLDLGGHTISHDAAEGGVAVHGGTITNGRLLGSYFLTASDAELSRLVIERTTLAVSGTRIHHNLLVDSKVVLEIDDFAPDGDDGSLWVEHNWLRSTPIYVANVVTSLYIEIDGNIIERSPYHGVDVIVVDFEPGDVEGSISRNWIVGNALDGIAILGDGGPALGALGDLTIADNLLVANGGDGIGIEGTMAYWRGSCPTWGVPCAPEEQYLWGGPVTIRDNLAFWNGGHGIHVDTPPLVIPGYGEFFPPPGLGVLDGGGNRALLNGERPQCVGVRCRWW